MGTSSSYSGSGGKPGKDLRNELNAWLESVGSVPLPEVGNKPDLPALPITALTPALFVPAVGRRSSGGGGGGGGGGIQGSTAGSGTSGGSSGRTSGRTIARYASSAGGAAAAARALREGDREALAKLGLDFDRLSALPNRFEMVRDIVEAICGAQTESSIDAEEQRAIAAQVADWVLDPNVNATTPPSENVAREAIAIIASQVFLTEVTAQVDQHSANVDRAAFEARVAETAQSLAATAHLTNTGATSREISKAIRRAIAGLRKIHPLKGKP